MRSAKSFTALLHQQGLRTRLAWRAVMRGCIAALLLGACADELGFSMPEVDPGRFHGPTVIHSEPLKGSHGIPPDYPAWVTFSENLRGETVTTAVSAVAESGTPFSFSVRLLEDRRTIVIRGPWPRNENLLIRIGATLLSSRGISMRDQDRFDGKADTPFSLPFMVGASLLSEPPRIQGSDPRHGDLEITPLVQPTLSFSKRMAPEPLWVALRGPDGAVPLRVQWELDHTRLRIIPERPLAYASVYAVELGEAYDAWGLPITGANDIVPDIRFVTQRTEGHVVINEIVTHPQQDWNETAGGNGIPFDDIPGTGSVTTSDEYIELYNGSPHAVDLSGWTLQQIDGSDQIHSMGQHSSVTERFSKAGSTLQHFQSGDYLVIGKPVGDNLDNVTLILRDANGFERDRVQFGNGAAPWGRATGIDDEAVLRIPNGADTDSDAQDWQKGPASPGKPN
jgi:hypothetical protein